MKAQIATEFLILIGFGMIMLTVLLIVISNNMKEVQQQQKKDLTKNLLFALQTEIFLANEMEEGYYREFKIDPKTFGNDNFSVYISNNLLFVELGSDISYSAIPKIIGNLTIGTNHVNKTNETVYLNE